MNPKFINFMCNYTLLRNCYEHHKVISKRGMQIPIQQWGIYREDGEKFNIGEVVEGGRKVILKWEKKTIAIKGGYVALLSYDDILYTSLYLQMVVPNTLEPKLVERVKENIQNRAKLNTV